LCEIPGTFLPKIHVLFGDIEENILVADFLNGVQSAAFLRGSTADVFNQLHGSSSQPRLALFLPRRDLVGGYESVRTIGVQRAKAVFI
jgi:hypothetical protein